jgi:hypothetical protein
MHQVDEAFFIKSAASCFIDLLKGFHGSRAVH